VAKKYEWVGQARSPVFTANVSTWRANERRFRGGRSVAAELTPFDWEVKNKIAHYRHRQSKIVYENFPARYVEAITGHIIREDFKVDWKELGDPENQKDLAYYFQGAIDGTTKDASSLTAFVKEQIGWSIVTGHRFIMADAPRVGSQNLRDVKAGRRGWLSGISPTVVPDFHYVDGGLAYMILRVPRRMPTVKNSLQFDSGENVHHILMVRQGFDGFGEEFIKGGWWEFNKKFDLADGGSAKGDWAATGGEIPVSLLYYARDEYDATAETDDTYLGMIDRTNLRDTTISRSGTEVLGHISSTLMDLTSAQVFDVLDSAKGIQWLLNVSKSAHTIAMKMIRDGSRWPALPPPTNTGTGGAPAQQVVDSAMGAVPSERFDGLCNRLREIAIQNAMLEALGGLDASGISKSYTFQHREGAKLADMATETEQTFKTSIGYLAALSGQKKWTGKISVNKKFDLTEFGDRVMALFQAESLAGISSETADAEGLTELIKQLRITTDATVLEKIKGEYKASSAAKTKQATQLGALARRTGVPPNNLGA
jgi:hypothetical protein